MHYFSTHVASRIQLGRLGNLTRRRLTNFHFSPWNFLEWVILCWQFHILPWANMWTWCYAVNRAASWPVPIVRGNFRATFGVWSNLWGTSNSEQFFKETFRFRAHEARLSQLLDFRQFFRNFLAFQWATFQHFTSKVGTGLATRPSIELVEKKKVWIISINNFLRLGIFLFRFVCRML